MKNARIQVKTILFDLDGTLVDTELVAAKVVAEFFKKWKIKPNIKDAEQVVGRTWQVAIGFLAKKYVLPVTPEIAFDQMLKRYRSLLKKKLTLIPGGVESVLAFKKKFNLGLVSGSNRIEVDWILKKLRIYSCFKVILTADDYSESKPSPEGYLNAMALMRANPKETLIFEDSAAGIKAARSAGAWVVCVGEANHFKQDQSLAHQKIKNFKGVDVEWVRALL